MAVSGRFVGLNLGPAFSAGGAYVGLNLGVAWDVDPPEPVIRGIRSSSTLLWQRSGMLRRLSTVSWRAGEMVGAASVVSWTPALSRRADACLPWGLTPLLLGAVSFEWRSGAGAYRAAIDFPWRPLGVERQGVAAGWKGKLAGGSQAAVLAWNASAATSLSVDLQWFGKPARGGCFVDLRWRMPGLGRRAATLPWGAAKPVPWIVRPPVPGPDPDPDPDPIAPPGAYVALNLGCRTIGVPGFAPLNLGVTACYVVRPQRRTYVVINSIAVVRLPDRLPIQVESVSISSSVDAWGSSYDLELADTSHLALLKPTAAGPRLVEITLNGYVWTAIVEGYGQRREWSRAGVTLTGRSRTALLAAPYAPGRVKTTTEERSAAQLVAEELADTGFSSSYDTVDWLVPAGAWFYDATPALDAISRLAEASGGVVQSHPSEASLRVRARYPHSPWDWRDRTPDHVVQEDIVSNESLQVRSAPLYDAVVVTGELAGKGVTCKVRRAGEAGQLFAQQVSSPLINTSAVAAERGRNILADRGEQAAIDLVLPLFAGPLRPGEVGRVLPLDLVEVVGEAGTWHGLCTAVRTEARISDKAAVIEQTITLERHYTDAD